MSKGKVHNQEWRYVVVVMSNALESHPNEVGYVDEDGH